MQYKLVAGIAVSAILAVSSSLFGTSDVARVTPIITEVSSNTASSTKEKIEEKAVLNPALLKVALCESGMKQFNADGTVVRGKVNPHDIGILQINSDYHEATAISMGYDIYTEKGNIQYGNYLYEAQGLAPWNWSRKCWGN